MAPIEHLSDVHNQQLSDLTHVRTRRMKFFVGQVMKQTKGKANPQHATAAFERLLGEAGNPTD